MPSNNSQNATDFFEGLRGVVYGLAEATQRSNYSLGIGSLAGGLALAGLGALSITGAAAMMITVGAFALGAAIGRRWDDGPPGPPAPPAFPEISQLALPPANIVVKDGTSGIRIDRWPRGGGARGRGG